MLKIMESGNKVFKVLSIDGGGIKGLYSSTILEHFEKKFNCRISDYFDMLCGTSTGGLIALALSLKIPAENISKFYIEKGEKIFPKQSKIMGKYRQIFWKGKYSDIPLKKILNELFGNATLADSNNLLCIPSYSFTDARPWVFKWDHPEGNLTRDNKARYIDVALATSAAPTFFPLCEIENYNNKQFIDGGVWSNNPTLVGLIEALKYFVGVGKKYSSLNILSISSLTHVGGKIVGLKRRRSFINWRNDLFETPLTGQSMFSDYFLKSVTDINNAKINYTRIPSVSISSEQESLTQLDEAKKEAIDLIRGKGNDMGDLWEKKEEIAAFFNEKKSYEVN